MSTVTSQSRSRVGVSCKLTNHAASSHGKVLKMKRLFAAALIVCLVPMGLVGCSENTSSVKRETKISTPGGTTTITTEKQVEKTGDDSSSDAP